MEMQITKTGFKCVTCGEEFGQDAEFYTHVCKPCLCFSEENVAKPENEPIYCPEHGVIL